MFEITDEFLAQAGFGALPAEDKETMRRNAEQRVSTKITEKVIVVVGEENLDAFENMLDGDDALALLNWCQEHGIDLTNITQESMNETMAELQKLYNDALNAVRE